MVDPWLTIVGLGEDGLPGLAPASLAALERAEIVFGGPRHLALVEAGARGMAWTVPFSVAPVLAARGRRVVVLASGDPFWFGAGGALVTHLEPGEWISHPASSVFALIASALGWRLEETGCHGLHAAPFGLLRADLQSGRRLICTLRDAAAVEALALWLTTQGAGGSRLHVAERIGGPHARLRSLRASDEVPGDIAAPVAVAIEVEATQPVPRTPGLPDDAFAHAGQITKRHVRALTLCALAPRPGLMLWDLGAGSGSISVEWALQDGRALAVEARADRVALIAENIARFGLEGRVEMLEMRLGTPLPAALTDRPPPDAVFVGGGADARMLGALERVLPSGARLVVNAVTLETEALLSAWHGRLGGDLLRIELAQAEPLGTMRGWTPSRPVVQWSVTL